MNPNSLGALYGDLPEHWWAPVRRFDTRATVEVTRYEPFIDERIWLGQHCKGGWHIKPLLRREVIAQATGMVAERIKWEYTVEFEDTNDAMLFKLTWGGA